MKILFNCAVPFMLAHGGAQIQIEQTKRALEHAGVAVDFLRWWDDQQHADVLHHFGRIPIDLLRLAQAKGMKVVQSDLLTGQGSRPLWKHHLHRAARAVVETVLPGMLGDRLGWTSYRLADASIALTPWEGFIMKHVFAAPPDRVHVVPNGVETLFFEPRALDRGNWLVTTATITPRKRVVELAEAAVLARTPLWVIGKAYHESDPYARRFVDLAKQHQDLLRYEGAVTDRAELAKIYSQARGFVLLSTMESLSLSALEAAACGCPLLLSDLPWARCSFEQSACYCPITSPSATAPHLRTFYDAASRLPVPPQPLTWADVAAQLKIVYGSL